MVAYLRMLGAALIVLGLAGSAVCLRGAQGDEAYYKAVRGAEKYPGNVLYQTELRMAEPRHMLLVAGATASLPAGLVFGSLCLGIAAILGRANHDDRGRESSRKS